MAERDETTDTAANAAADLIRTVPQRFALYLDLDGTLVDIAPEPDQVVISPMLVGHLSDVCRLLDGAVAILSGRPLSEIDKFLAPLKLAGAGVHGAEVRHERDGGIVARVSGVPADVRDGIVQAIDRLGTSRILIEQKSAGVAVHVRSVPDLEDEVARLLHEIVALRGDRLRVERGRRVIEVLPQAVSKGEALDTLARKRPFAGRRPVVIGDDVSDEAAFTIARAAGGFALPVAGERFPRDTAVFSSPEAVRVWLSTLISDPQARLS